VDDEERVRLHGLADYLDDHGPFEGGRGGVHRDLVRLYIETAQRAVRTWLACQRDDGLEELVAPEVNDAHLAAFRAVNAHHLEPWPQSLEHLEYVLIEEAIGQLKNSLGPALSRFSIGIGGLEDRYSTIYSVSFLQLYNHLAEGAIVRRARMKRVTRHSGGSAAGLPTSSIELKA
jgi:hypothetical protein